MNYLHIPAGCKNIILIWVGGWEWTQTFPDSYHLTVFSLMMGEESIKKRATLSASIVSVLIFTQVPMVSCHWPSRRCLIYRSYVIFIYFNQGLHKRWCFLQMNPEIEHNVNIFYVWFFKNFVLTPVLMIVYNEKTRKVTLSVWVKSMSLQHTNARPLHCCTDRLNVKPLFCHYKCSSQFCTHTTRK